MSCAAKQLFCAAPGSGIPYFTVTCSTVASQMQQGSVCMLVSSGKCKLSVSLLPASYDLSTHHRRSSLMVHPHPWALCGVLGI